MAQALAGAAVLVLGPAAAKAADLPNQVSPAVDLSTGFETYKIYLAQRAQAAGVGETVIQAHIPSLQLSQRAIGLDRAQRPGSRINAESPPLRPYLAKHISPALIWKGQERYHALWPNLVRLQATHGVDAAVLLAIYGKETSYGRVTGSFDLLEVLASLAYEGRRRELFETEFLAALKLIESGISRSMLRGSYAGATGYPQFMPSVVLRLRTDGDSDGYADIWGNEVDALASVANYLRDAGWKADVPWGAAARVPATLDRQLIRANNVDARCPAVSRRLSRWQSVADWRALGVTPVGRSLPDTEMVTLLEPEGPAESPYLLTQNYRAILGYNCSNFYGMSVALLSDAIARR